ncbi:hypothetical protein EUGRSUZ_F02341 [Eucalyptus grandis]|uniref:Uncharacterized protein n=2 Tax=Eucalyptus grandis TaxID=71139 RepID=A0ACC3KGC1_EUCGR|nr:hypothetical protein EUGRSUZ_F02341 [Eucalyptus grandis]
MEPRSISFVEFPSCHSLVGIVLVLCFAHVSSTTNETDKLSLLAFKAGITENPLSVLSLWNNSMGFCQWYGRELQLGNNSLNHEIPPQISQLSRLQILWLENNSLVGEIPKNIAACFNLVSLTLAFNQLFGKIPTQVGSLSNLQLFYLHVNNLIGSVPSSLGNLSSLERLVFSLNNLGGSIPPTLGHLSKLQLFMVAQNKLSGPILTEVLNLSSLSDFDVGVNHIQGSLPAYICFTLPNLHVNYLGGTILSSLGNLTKLAALNLSGNNFQDQIPSELSNYFFLNKLDLSRNNLNGTIPPQIMSKSSQIILMDLSHNRLIGALPMEVGNLRFLTALSISKNMLGGEIPNSLGDCVALVSLMMGGNSFHRSIPQSMRSLRGIEELDLSHNNFSREIPQFLETFRSLKVLNLSYNNFKGMLPCEGVFENATSTPIIGNAKLCGGLLEFQLPKCISSNSKSRKVNVLRLSTVVICGLLGIAFVLAILYLSWRKRQVQEPAFSSMVVLCPNISYGMLLKATNGFSSTNMVGVGSFGSVYKGILEDNRTTVAMKVLHLVGRGALKSFVVGCEVLKNIRHRNLLKILTVCSSVDYERNDFKAIVYDFMDNGSLE